MHARVARRVLGPTVALVAAACGASSTSSPPNAAAPPPQRPAVAQTISASARFVGSAACASCHAAIYARWKKTPMANVVRDPREHPDAIIPDLTTNPFEKFDRADVALVYGSLWKQRYFTKRGDDYFVQPVQWDVQHKVFKKYFVENGTDWWSTLYPPDNRERPTGPLCDGCHSVDYDVKTKKVVEWNVGCERCHGPGSDHLARPTRETMLNPGGLDDVQKNDVCIQCHSQGRPLVNPIEGRLFDWPVGYRVGLHLADHWRLEEHKLGETSFTHYAEGSAHKNRMQGNDFVQSVMYKHGVKCANCHDTHGTDNPAQLRLAGNALCATCHEPNGRNGPRAASFEAHSHHGKTSAGSECVACHMPKIATTIGDVRVRSHTFAFITPKSTERYKVPNPCTTCHADKSIEWATTALRGWGVSPWRLD